MPFPTMASDGDSQPVQFVKPNGLHTRPHGTLDRQGTIGADALPVSSVSTKVRPIRFFWIQATLHSRTDESFAMTRRKRWGTNAGFSTSMAAPSIEIFRTTQPMTEPPDDT